MRGGYKLASEGVVEFGKGPAVRARVGEVRQRRGQVPALQPELAKTERRPQQTKKNKGGGAYKENKKVNGEKEINMPATEAKVPARQTHAHAQAPLRATPITCPRSRCAAAQRGSSFKAAWRCASARAGSFICK